MMSLEPPEYPLCAWCDGCGTVEVFSILDVDGNPHEINPYMQYPEICIPCRRCDGKGLEPSPDPNDNPNIP